MTHPFQPARTHDPLWYLPPRVQPYKDVVHTSDSNHGSHPRPVVVRTNSCPYTGEEKRTHGLCGHASPALFFISGSFLSTLPLCAQHLAMLVSFLFPECHTLSCTEHTWLSCALPGLQLRGHRFQQTSLSITTQPRRVLYFCTSHFLPQNAALWI